MPHGADGIIDLVDYLKHPFHSEQSLCAP
jgi:hypothetical protein